MHWVTDDEAEWAERASLGTPPVDARLAWPIPWDRLGKRLFDVLAAKLTGRVGQYSIGVLQAFTRQEDASIWNTGIVTQRIVEPATSYSLARVRREFANQSSIDTRRSTA